MLISVMIIETSKTPLFYAKLFWVDFEDGLRQDQ